MFYLDFVISGSGFCTTVRSKTQNDYELEFVGKLQTLTLCSKKKNHNLEPRGRTSFMF